MLFRSVMATGTDKDLTVSALKGVFTEIDGLRQRDPAEFLFLNRMSSPVKKIQGKYRYQVLARLKSDVHLKEIYETAAKYTGKDVLVYVEENPSNLS